MKRQRITMVSIVLVLVMVISSISLIFAEETNTKYRIQNLVDQMKEITTSVVDQSIAKFNDMKNHWSKEFVGRLTYLEIIGGYTDGSFKPDQNIQVDEFIKLMVTAMGYKPEVGTGYWAEPFIEIAINEGLIEKGEFSKYNRPINRQEMAKIVVNATLKKEVEPQGNYLGLLRSKIKDYQSISDDYKHSVLTAYGLGLITGTPDGSFKPLNNATRAEASVVIMRFLDADIRQPIKVDTDKETITLKDNWDGKLVTVYPPSRNPEVVKIAHALNDSLKTSKGYAAIVSSAFSSAIVSYFFEKEEDSYSDETGITHMSIGIQTIDSEEVQKIPYDIIIWNPSKVKEQHNEVVKAFLTALFEKDADKVIAEYEKYLNLALTTDDGFSKKIVLNDRTIHFYRTMNKKQLDISISRKGFRY